MNLKELRKRIDEVDLEILALLNRRMELAVRTKKVKESLHQAKREEEVLEHVRAAARGLLQPDMAEKLFKEVISEAKRLQAQDFKLVGFQGEHGAYSELAIRKVYPGAVAIPHDDFKEVFDGVKSGSLDAGMLPVENSLGGNVTQVDDLLIETDLHITAEIILPVHHSLISLPETDYHDIRVVYSHPQALAQCQGFITRNKLEPRPYYDTAGAALMLSREKPAATAVIAASLCAELYSLEVLKENIEDHPSNSTRFLMIEAAPAKEPGDKCSIMFSTAHRPGALFCLLSAFSEAAINLTRIESKPLPGSPGHYAFLLDFMGSADDSQVKEALAKVEKEAVRFRLLGCYRRIET